MNMNMNRLMLLTMLTLPALAQPATAPAAKRFALVMPPGFEKVTLAGHTALCEPADKEWVSKALQAVKPATRPSTMPSDLITAASARRSELLKQMVADLGVAEEKQVSAFFDDKLLATLKKMQEVKPPVFFLVTTQEKLNKLCESGWGEPRFHYNRVAGAASYSDNVMVSIDKEMDDNVLPAFYVEKDTPEQRIEKLSEGIHKLDNQLVTLIAGQSQPAVYNLIAQYIGETYFEPLKLRRDQLWVGLGITTYLTSKYTSAITGVSKQTILNGMTVENPRYPVSAKGIDLTRPLEESAMKKPAVPHYNQAMRRKATLAIMKMVEQGGETTIPTLMLALKNRPPADGPSLVKLVSETTKVDLSKELAAQ